MSAYTVSITFSFTIYKNVVLCPKMNGSQRISDSVLCTENNAKTVGTNKLKCSRSYLFKVGIDTQKIKFTKLLKKHWIKKKNY